MPSNSIYQTFIFHLYFFISNLLSLNTYYIYLDPSQKSAEYMSWRDNIQEKKDIQKDEGARATLFRDDLKLKVCYGVQSVTV